MKRDFCLGLGVVAVLVASAGCAPHTASGGYAGAAMQTAGPPPKYAELPPIAVIGPTPTSDAATPAFTSSTPAPATPDVRPDDGGPIKVGVIHSLSGTMFAEETPLKDMALMAFDEINAAGGLLGRPLQPVVVDPASNWPLFAERARDLLAKEKVWAVFGGYTSVSRKSMLPVFEELHGLLFYPAQYEGERPSEAVCYTGALPNQSVRVVADYLFSSAKAPVSWFVVGTDYVVPRVQDQIIRRFLQERGVTEDRIQTHLTPFGHEDYASVVAELKRLAGRGRVAVISLLHHDSAVALQRELRLRGPAQSSLLTVAFGLDERQLAENAALFAGTLVARSYFSTIANDENAHFARRWQSYRTAHHLAEPNLPLNDDLEATYIGVNLWRQAVARAKSLDPQRVKAALANQTFASPSGFTMRLDPATHHLAKPYFVGEVGRTGKVTVIWHTAYVVTALPGAPNW